MGLELRLGLRFRKSARVARRRARTLVEKTKKRVVRRVKRRDEGITRLGLSILMLRSSFCFSETPGSELGKGMADDGC